MLRSLGHGKAALMGLSVGLVACATSAPVASEPTGAAPLEFASVADTVRSESCPLSPAAPDEARFDLTISHVSFDAEELLPDQFVGMRLAGIWHLETSDRRFGGLSGLVETLAGNLVAVSDMGNWVLIDVDEDTRELIGTARIAPMLGADGAPLSGKSQGDAEGLAVRESVALVSFERDHRVSGFDFGGCGPAAQEVVLTRLAPDIAGMSLPSNRGPEGLSLTETGNIRVGIESRETGYVVQGRLLEDGTLDEVLSTRPPAFHLLTGMDEKDGLRATVYRAYDPIRGARIRFDVSAGETEIATGRLKPPGPVDNLEGIAIGTGLDEAVRIWLIADDNFNPDQRTLLFAFDLNVTPRRP